MCTEILTTIYRARVVRGSTRVPLLEKILRLEMDVALSADDLRNEKINFERLFHGECKAFVGGLYRDTMSRMPGKSYEESEDELCLLAYLQDLVAVALWKHNLEPGDTLEGFARQFDRLDIEAERRRLYELAVK